MNMMDTVRIVMNMMDTVRQGMVKEDTGRIVMNMMDTVRQGMRYRQDSHEYDGYSQARHD